MSKVTVVRFNLSSRQKIFVLLLCFALLLVALLWGLLGNSTVERRLESMMMRVLVVPNSDLAALFEPYDSADDALLALSQQELQLALAGALEEFADAELLKQPVVNYELLGVHVSAFVHDYTILPDSVAVKPLNATGQYAYEATLRLNMAGAEDAPLALSGRIFINEDERVTYLDVGMSVQDLVAYFPTAE